MQSLSRTVLEHELLGAGVVRARPPHKKAEKIFKVRTKAKYLLFLQRALDCQNQRVIYFLLTFRIDNLLLYRIL